MITIDFSLQFKNALKKLARKKPETMTGVVEKILLLNNNVNHPSLKLYKLSGPLKDHWAISIEYDLRIIFRFTDEGNIVLIDIGNHD